VPSSTGTGTTPSSLANETAEQTSNCCAAPYLRPALDIPYCHHEKWDGTGYPRRLAGEQIPQAARIFAVVDVWDALGSDRPYRPAWPTAQVAEHVRNGRGTHFEPRVVDAFLDLGFLDPEPAR
jgi:HD-GYP domain-containing protein (c-di-GMP phosphodiesterase class II)